MYLLAWSIYLALPVVRPETTFTKETPLLWTETKEQWTSGSYELSLSLQLETPCRHLKEKDMNWCESEFDEKLFHPLQDLCMEAILSENPVQKRRKRSIFNIFKTIGSVVLGVATRLLCGDNGRFDGADLNQYNSRISGLDNEIRCLDTKIFSINQDLSRNKETITALNVQHEELNKDVKTNGAAIEKLNNDSKIFEAKLMENQKDLQNFKKEMSDELAKLNKALTDFNAAITDLDEWPKDMDETLSDRIKAIGSFVAYFLQLETQMNAFSRNWRRGILSDKFFDIFTLSRNDTIVSEYSGTKPKSCRFSKSTKLAVFYFQKNSVDSGIVILQAKPFRLHKPIPDTEQVEILSYRGPQNVLYLPKNQCTIPFDKDNGLIYMPSSDDCHIFERQHTFQKFWVKSCDSDIAVYGKDVQIQQMGEKLFIYCYGQDISIYGHSQPCPNYVFSIHFNEKFQILKFGSGSLLKHQSYEPRNDLLTSKINHRIIPNILQINFDDIPATNGCLSSKTNHAAIWTSITAVLVILAIAAYLYRRRMSMKVQKNVELNDSNGIETMVREEVAKQLSSILDPIDGTNPPSYASCMKQTTVSTKLASLFKELNFPDLLEKFRKSSTKENNDDGLPGSVKDRVKMLGVKVM